VAHVFAQADVGDGNEIGTFCFDGSQRLLNNPVFGISGAGLFVFLSGNPEKKDGLQPEILNALCFIDNLLEGELKNPWHARNRPAPLQFLAHEKRENKIVGSQLCLADEISQGRGTPQTAGPMH
jgi:hypothetical protein